MREREREAAGKKPRRPLENVGQRHGDHTSEANELRRAHGAMEKSTRYHLV